ncbi:unnamed protein product [Adineta steineri]|uniref:Peptidase M14 domain-containing protein n=1 Tax=Adineta steineri TaxID=433720 RepID=A0A814VEQ3_9BILA|nr:unnamed protein product [Adineta steineri]
MVVSMLKLPAIVPSTSKSDISLSVKVDTNAYEQWRSNIHRELEEDLQRQVEQLLEESERQERLSKLQRQYRRTGQCPPLQQADTVDKWSEIDRRNARVLHPLNSKNSFTAQKRLSTYYQFEKNSNKSFYFNSYHSYRSRRRSSQPTDDQNCMSPTMYLNKYMNKASSVPPINNNLSFVFGNSIIKSNKAEVLNIFEQKFTKGDKSNIYVDKNGVIITEDGPFWPDNYRILHPTPKLLSRELLQDEFNLSSSTSNVINQQTYDNQPAIYKYTETIKHPIIIYDMDKTARNQQIKPPDNEHMCPQLIFESRFEGGNLRQVKRVGQFEYELVLRPDLNTRRHTQWYHFRVQNMIANITYRFRIINLMKKSSLYNDGMQILLFSGVDAKKESRGWNRVGHHINYSEYKPRSYNPLLERDINYYELDFQFEFTHSGDTCYIAHCYPYTYTDLKDDLEYLSKIRPSEIFRRDILCESQAGNSCFIITVTDEAVPINKKKFVFISARIHPGETNSSFMMRGLLEYITSNDKIAQKLRTQLVFKIIPMLNPDGVIIGNYRCSLTGKDKNRNFRHPRKQTFPIIYHMKELVQKLQKERREILAFCDLHGHSRKLNVFAYGCDGCDGAEPDMKNFLDARVLPFIMSKTAPDMFSFDFCKFHIHRCKESTGRVVMWKEMLIKNSFTLEASFAGSNIVENARHFNIQAYEKFGQSICQSLRHYLEILSDSSQLDSIFMDITKSIVSKLNKDKLPLELSSNTNSEKQADESQISINSVSNCLDILAKCHKTINEQNASSSSDSDSDPEGGELPDIVVHKDEQIPKKKLKKRRSDKAIEERVEKLNRKRQMDKANRTLPERGTLFTSKYANRNGNGLPIFTTERAYERKHQTDEHDTDFEQELFFTKAHTSRIDDDLLRDQDRKVKRTTSLVSLPEKEAPKLSTDQIIKSALLPPSRLLRKKSPQKQSEQVHHRSRQSHETETQQINNILSPINDNDITSFDTSIELNSNRSISKHESSSSSTKMPLLNNNTTRKTFAQRINKSLLQQPLNSKGSKFKQRSLDILQENKIYFDPTEPINQRLKKQFNLSIDKK